MNKFLRCYFFSTILLVISCGVMPSKLKEAKEKGDNLLEKITLNTITNEFPRDEFTPESVDHVLKELRINCGFDNKNGVFINDFIQNDNGTKYIHLLYEFPLNCGNKRIMIMYMVQFGELKLVGFGVEPAEKENFMITHPERQLKNN
jgi:hypothetical protein